MIFYIRRKKDQDDQLYYKMNNYHKNTKLTIKTNPSKFLDTGMDIKEDGHYNRYTKRKQNSPFNGHQKYLKDINVTHKKRFRPVYKKCSKFSKRYYISL